MTTPAVPEIAVEDPDRMRALGARLAPLLRAGDLIILDGPLGAGKTVFVQGLAAGLGVRSPVTSPTFVLARVHTDGRLPLVHVDAYRLGGVAEVDDLDLDADLGRSVCVVEWGSGLVEQLAGAHLRVEISRPAGDEAGEVRRVRLRPAGADWATRLTSLAVPDLTSHPQGSAAG
ncbi:tRNA (adenosine(37)-N6)-threonylcarbamoyltransferase complex ATPase subunit type 1 TsaE [Parafrankia discariae]|uniref:tRNA (adenosine(37)-N6)-threonylcarbamoyltransferase complex ATPase subunit type 1 TsaE n=1 Tax=Parafrankia discariae TaxID=365528 RepID=UPI000685EF94|nr:tRNA (adenosine(37)-N6)-threonylcarbamoyltransferase complex ATPase subunit type 1 TsaE [Parafrankia discariae]